MRVFVRAFLLLFYFTPFGGFVFMAQRRGKMPRGHSRRVFKKGAMNVHPKNAVSVAGPMRGGIRL